MTDPTVLVVDDDEVLLNLMSRRLVKQGLVVTEADSGRTAIGMIENEVFDLVVTDIYMPGVTGLELLKLAKEKEPHTQVVVVTAAATMENAIEALNFGAFAYLTKPFDHLSVFDSVVSRALDYRRLLQDNLRLAEIQRRRGDMLEEEVTERVMQLQKRRREMLDLLACLPEGVVVVAEGGRIEMTNPEADRWLALDQNRPDRPIRKYFESLDDEWAAKEWEVDIGRRRLNLFTSELPNQNDKQRRVVVLREAATDVLPEIADALVELKHGLAWVYTQDLEEQVSGRVALMAKLVADLEELTRSPGGLVPGGGPAWSAVTDTLPGVSMESEEGIEPSNERDVAEAVEDSEEGI